MKKKSLFLVIALLLVFSSVLAACGSDEKTTGDKKPSTTDGKKNLAAVQELNLASTADIPDLDQSTATDAVSFIVFSNVFEGLYTLGENDKVEPGIAKADPKKSEDGKVWTIDLRDDAKWSNGDPVTAHDFVYGWQRTLAPDTKSEYASMMYSIKNAEAVNTGALPADQLGVKAIDDYTLEITWEKVYPYTQSLLAFGTFMPQNQKYVESQGENFAKEANTQVYNGPFVLESWDHGQGWSYKKNDQYWDKENVTLDTINVQVIKDDNTRLQLYNKGELDRANLAAVQVPQNKNSDDFKVEKDSSTFFLKMNQKNELLANVHARKAMAMAIDKEAFTEKILSDGSTPTDYLVPDDFAYDENGKEFHEGYPDELVFNIEEAKKEWALAKKDLGKDTFTIEFLNYDTASAKKVGEFIKEQLETNLEGLTVNIVPKPFGPMLEDQKALNYDITYAGWGPDYPDPMTFLELYETNNSFNRSMYSNPEYDAIIAAANGPLLDDPAKRWTEMQKAEKILIEEDQAIVPLYQRSYSYLENPKVEGVMLHNFAGDYTYKDAYIAK